MDAIQQQVKRARRRLVVQQFLALLPWTLFGALLVAAGAIAVPKIWPLWETSDAASSWTWVLSWSGGAVVVGLAAAALWTYFVRRTASDAALEIDRRFGLKERVSSALALNPAQHDSEAGRALLDDAARRVARVDVSERFGVSVRWTAAMPLVPAIALLLVLLLPNAVPQQVEAATDEKAMETEAIKQANERLKKQLEEQRKEMEEKGLEEAKALFERLEAQLAKLNQKDQLNRKEALIEINDLKKELEKRREQLGDSQQLKEQLKRQLNELATTETGPADRLAEAMKEGDFQKAVNELNKLKDKIGEGELSDEDKEKLAQQIDQMKQKLSEMAQAHDEAKKDLEQQIQQKIASGQLGEAADLQQKLDQLNKQQKQMDSLQKMSDKLGQCSQCLAQGNGQQAAQDLQAAAEQLQAMADDMQELESLDFLADQIAEAKNALNCDQCQGAGCAACQGKDGFGGQGQGEGDGDGLGEGQGHGERPEEQTDTGTYESQVRGTPKQGEVVRGGDADGPNVAGRSAQDVRQAIEAKAQSPDDPQVNVKLPRNQRDHTKQYFERFREGE